MYRWLPLLFAVAACGRPATLEDCELIVERITQLEMEQRNASSPEAVQAEVEATKQAVRDSMLSQCVGRRITDSSLECVRNARSSEEIVNECFEGWK
jgi:hypothetical protein